MSKKLKATDPARFEGNGISYRAKIIGIEDVDEARGDRMCQEMIQKLKTAVKTSGQHKQRVFINVTLEGLKIIDGVSMAVLHTHPVHQISFISRDITDGRAFGYIFGAGDGTHKFFGIKTANAAENVVLALRDLFQTVYEMKKQEMEDAKAKAAAGTEGQGDAENPDTTLKTAPDGQTGEGQESIYQVPKNNAPVNPQEQEEAVANLLDLEDQVDHILKGIEQIKNLEFDELKQEEAPRQPLPTSPTAAPTAATNDPWGAPTAGAAPATIPASSSLSDLQQLANPPPTSVPFGGMQAFSAATPFGAAQPGMVQPGMMQAGMVRPGAMPFGVPAQQPGMAMPMTRDPFGDMQRGQPPQMMGVPQGQQFVQQQPGFANPFPGTPFPGTMPAPAFSMGGQPAFPAQPFGVQAAGGPMPGAFAGAPFQQQQQQPDENLLQPIKPFQEDPAPAPAPGQVNLFGDLVDIGGGGQTAAKSPKEMFQELAQTPKKSLMEIKRQASPVPPSQTPTSPFGDAFLAPVNGKPTDAKS